MKRLLAKMMNILLHIIHKKELAIGKGSFVDLRKIRFNQTCGVSIGQNSNINAQISFDRPGAHISIGDRTFIGNSSLVSSRNIEIGNDVLIAWGCSIVDHNSHSLSWEERKNDVMNWNSGRKDWSAVKSAPVVIADKVWLGFNVIVLKGVHIGEGAVIGAGSVVTKDVPAFTLYAGNPAKYIRDIAPAVGK